MFRLPLPGLLLCFGLPQYGQADTHSEMVANCGGCHAFEQPDYHRLGIALRTERKGPPLYYAGNKYRADWLVAWLQKPVRLRPAGVYPPAHIEVTDKEDVVLTDTLEAHLVLDADTAHKVAEQLMTLRPFDDRLAAVDYEPGTIAMRMGQMNFVKFNNCSACHQDEPGYGGLSGPELYSAWHRLQPKFIASYIADPVSWDPHTLMPGGELNDAAVKKLVDYLKLIAEEEQ